MRKISMMAAAGAVASIFMLASGANATSPITACSEGQLKNWVKGEGTGGTELPPVCYHGASGNVVECTSSGNHIVVTVTTGGQVIYTQPGEGVAVNQCFAEVEADCDVSRALGTGNTSNFQFYCD
jgi:hypothetical protein